MKYGILMAILGAAVLLVGCAGEEEPSGKQAAAPSRRQDFLNHDGGPKPPKDFLNAQSRPKEPKSGWPFARAAFVAGGRVLWTLNGQSLALLDATSGRSLRTIRPEPAHLGSVLLLPDGQHAVTVGPKVVCWDIDTGKELWSFADQPQMKDHFCAAVSADGSWGVHANQNGTLRLWDVPNGQVRTLVGRHTDVVRWVTFSPDSQWLLSGSSDGTIKQWNVRQGVLHRTVPGEGRGSGAFSPDSKYALTTTSEVHTAALWEVASGKEIRRLKLAPQAIYQLAFLPDGQHVVAVGDDHIVRTWDINTGQLVRESYWKDGLGADSVVLSADGKRALLIGTDTLAFWDLENNEEVRTLANRFARVHGVGEVKCVSFSPDGRQVFGRVRGQRAPRGYWNALVTWDAETGRALRTTKVDDEAFWTVWSADGKRALTCYSNSVAEISLWDVATGRRVRDLEQVHGQVHCLDLSPDGRFALGSHVNLTLPMQTALLLWDLETGKLIQTFARELSEEQFQCVHFSADGRTILAGTSRWRVWDVATGKLLHDWPGPDGLKTVVAHPYRAVFSRDGKRALTYGAKLQLWDLTTGALLLNLVADRLGNLGLYTAAALSADGKRALSAGGPAEGIQLWDLSRGQAVRTFVGRGMAGRIDSLAFSPDGKWAVADGEWIAQIWDVTRGRDIRNLVLDKAP
jgi:WD40 repeat protein